MWLMTAVQGYTTSAKRKSKCKQQLIDLTLRHVDVLSSADKPSAAEYFQQQFNVLIYASESLLFHEEYVLK